MKSRLAALSALSLALLLTGCTQYTWVKPGLSDAEMHKKLTECEAQALVDLPPDNVVTGSSSEKTDKKQKKQEQVKDHQAIVQRVAHADKAAQKIQDKNSHGKKPGIAFPFP